MLENSNYYEILGVNLDSSTLEIKKAYFSMVRKYPPERFPEEFKRVREAYNTLSDPENRLIYDSRINDRGFGDLFDKADKAYGECRYEEALVFAGKALQISPENKMIRNLMGFCYAHIGEMDKCVNIFKKLAYDFPDKAVCHYNLGMALTQKGSYKQAEEAFKTSLRLNDTEIDSWKDLGLCYFKQGLFDKAREVLLKGIQKCGENTSIYMNLIDVDVAQKKLENLTSDVEKLERLAKKDVEMRENVSWSLAEIAENIMADMPDFAAKLLEKAKKLNPTEKEIKSLHKDASKMQKLNAPFEKMSKDPVVHPWVKDIIEGKLFGYENTMHEMDLSICERLVSRDPSNILSSVKHIKSAYPEIFNECKKFLQTVLDNPTGSKVDEKKLLNDMKYMDDFAGREVDITNLTLDDVFIPPMPHVRAVTVGRNDPCPCGSGKKYKKCCIN